MQTKTEILLGLTTTPASDWERKCNEIKTLGLKKIALFPTYLEIEDRKKLYALLENSGIEEIPHVHLRNQDMEAWEMELFEKKYRTEVYNIHTNAQLVACLEKFRDKIYVENDFEKIDLKHLCRFAGLCLDTEHFARAERIAPKTWMQLQELLQNFPVGCCHVSPKHRFKNIFRRITKGVWRHYMLSLDELDYVGQYRQYLPKYISLELENSFAEQLQARAYLEKIINL